MPGISGIEWTFNLQTLCGLSQHPVVVWLACWWKSGPPRSCPKMDDPNRTTPQHPSHCVYSAAGCGSGESENRVILNQGAYLVNHQVPSFFLYVPGPKLKIAQCTLYSYFIFHQIAPGKKKQQHSNAGGSISLFIPSSIISSELQGFPGLEIHFILSSESRGGKLSVEMCQTLATCHKAIKIGDGSQTRKNWWWLAADGRLNPRW